jgi:hypothetical protein
MTKQSNSSILPAIIFSNLNAIPYNPLFEKVLAPFQGDDFNDDCSYENPAFYGADDKWAQFAKRPRITPSIIRKIEAKPKLSYKDIPILIKASEMAVICDHWFFCKLRMPAVSHSTSLGEPLTAWIFKNWLPLTRVRMDGIPATILNKTIDIPMTTRIARNSIAMP